jgi:hypothetical protein
MQGYRVVHEKEAKAYDRLPGRAVDEFGRKVRTLSGNFQLLSRLPAALVPAKNPLWIQFVSHKLGRLLVPWALLGLLGTSVLLSGGALYRFAVLAQLAIYGVSLIGFAKTPRLRLPLASTCASFVVLNAAAWAAFWVWITGRAGRSWKRIEYRVLPPSPAASLETASDIVVSLTETDANINLDRLLEAHEVASPVNAALSKGILQSENPVG